jgi:DNA repair exonuclease SbcCD nuclease subunit
MTSVNTSGSCIKNYEIAQNNNKQITKFIHASDIHLGSHQYRNDHRANDFIHVFEEILSKAISHQVDFILLGGDVFSSLEMLPGKLTKIVNILRDFNENTEQKIPVIAIEGNHDIRKFSRGVRFKERGQSWLKFLSNLGLIVLLDAEIDVPPKEMFKPYDFQTRKGGKIQVKNVVVYGTRYLKEKPEDYLVALKEGIIKDDGNFHILLQHFGIEGQMENVPGVNYERIKHLKERVHYLALGHYHLQFILDDWVYNPGSSEAACSPDFSYKRGAFLVTISDEDEYIKEVKKLQLSNRAHVWVTIYFKTEFRTKEEVNEFIIRKLKRIFKLDNKSNHDPSNIHIPVLFLILKGRKPFYKIKIDTKNLTQLLCENLPVVDVRIYQKFSDFLTKIDTFI